MALSCHGVGNPVVQQLRSEGLAEIHRHLNGNALPNLLWAYLVLPPYRLVPKELAGNVDGLEGRDCIALIRTARDLRAALIWRLHKQYVTRTWNEARPQPVPKWCELRLMVASDSNAEDAIIRQFKKEFDSKKKECAVLIIRATSNSGKLTITGFDDVGKFRTVVIDDPSHKLSEELKKKPINKSRIVELAISSLGRTLPEKSQQHQTKSNQDL